MYPIFLKIKGKNAVVVGAGAVSERKIQSLLDAGANVTVIAPDATDRIIGLSDKGELRWEKRCFRRRDIRGAMLVITATDDPVVNAKVYQLAAKNGQLVNSVDDPEHCSFYVPAIVRRDPLLVAISTSGRTPLLAKHLRRFFDRKLYPGIGTDVEQLGVERDGILSGLSELSQKERARRVGDAQETAVQSIIERIEQA